jgi:hypothetical protein
MGDPKHTKEPNFRGDTRHINKENLGDPRKRIMRFLEDL